MATARTTVEAERQGIRLDRMNGSGSATPAVSFLIEYDPGDEDYTIDLITGLLAEVVAKINAARPAAASTPQEGTTTS
ncbi:MAG TPA: hypothetical protein PK478_00730 [Nitrospira sp.]|nr:hypothetical protein [Nitrospira sp.]